MAAGENTRRTSRLILTCSDSPTQTWIAIAKNGVSGTGMPAFDWLGQRN